MRVSAHARRLRDTSAPTIRDRSSFITTGENVVARSTSSSRVTTSGGAPTTSARYWTHVVAILMPEDGSGSRIGACASTGTSERS